MNRQYEIREGGETVRMRGVSLPSRLVAFALCFSLLLSCIPINMFGQKQEAEAVVPLVGGAAAAAAALGITETELAAACAALLAAYVGVSVDWSSVYGCLTVPGDYSSAVDVTQYGSNVYPYVNWRDIGLDIPSWGDLTNQEQSDYGGWAWHYDEAVWYAWWCQYMGISGETPPGPGDPGDPDKNRKWNTLKAMAKSGAQIAAPAAAVIAPLTWMQSLFGNYTPVGGGQTIFNDLMLDGKSCPFATFSITGVSGNQYWSDVESSNWFLGCIQRVFNTMGDYQEQYLYYRHEEPVSSLYEFQIRVSSSGDSWEFVGVRNPGSYGSVMYVESTNTWSQNTNVNMINGSGRNYKLGQTLEIDQTGTVITNKTYFLNSNYSGLYNYTLYNGSPMYFDNMTKVNDYQHEQITGYPQELSGDIYNNDISNYNNYFQTMQPSTAGNTVTLKNPYFEGNATPEWEDFFGELPNDEYYDVPTTNPGETDVPTPEPTPDPEPDPDYGNRLQNIADLAFSQVFPFCLINDIKRLSDKIVLTASAQPDFSVTLPLSDFGVDGLDEIVLDANHPVTGGGLIDIGNYTRPIFTVLFIAVLLGFSIKLFLR